MREAINLDKPEEVRRFNKAEDEMVNLEDLEEVGDYLEEEEFQERQVPRGRKRQKAPVVMRNSPIEAPLEELDSYEWAGVSLRAGETIELVNGTFIKIKLIAQHRRTHEVILWGWLLQRTGAMKDHHLPKKLNELCFIFEVDLDDPRDAWEQSVVEATPKDIVQVRELICTQRPWPACRYDQKRVPNEHFRSQAHLKRYVAENEVLVVRWKSTTRFDNARDRLENTKKVDNGRNYRQRRVELLAEEECSHRYAMPASVRRENWRGPTDVGGSGIRKKTDIARSEGRTGAAKRGSSARTAINVDDEDDDEIEQVWTYGDACKLRRRNIAAYTNRVQSLELAEPCEGQPSRA
jgi:DNA (cytosine-5)-methyltransferase 1